MVAPSVLPGKAFAQTTPNSNLFLHWRAQDRSLATVDRTSTGTLTRASAGGLTDGRGQRTANALTDVRLVGAAADNQPRWGVSTAGLPHLLMEDTRTNLMPISNPTTGWQISTALSTGGEITVAPDGTLVPLLTDPSTTATNQMTQDIEWASTVGIATWYTKWNGSTFGAIHALRVHDNSTAADRGRVDWQFGSTGAMSITSTSAGTLLSGPTHIGNNWWKSSLECAGISTGNDNQIEFIPALLAATTGGDMFIAHSQVEDVVSTGLFASSHIPTVSAAVTRAAERLSFPFLPVPQKMTVYIKWVESGTFTGGGAVFDRLFELSSTGETGAYLRCFATGATNIVRVDYNDGTNTETVQTAGSLLSRNDIGELRVVYHGDGTLDVGITVNDGAEAVTLGGASLASNASQWGGGSALLYLNSRDTANVGFAKFREVKIAAGNKTRSQMREAF